MYAYLDIMQKFRLLETQMTGPDCGDPMKGPRYWDPSKGQRTQVPGRKYSDKCPCVNKVNCRYIAAQFQIRRRRQVNPEHQLGQVRLRQVKLVSNPFTRVGKSGASIRLGLVRLRLVKLVSNLMTNVHVQTQLTIDTSEHIFKSI